MKRFGLRSKIFGASFASADREVSRSAPKRLARAAPNTSGYVDYVDSFGNKLGTGANPPGQAIYTRRWSITPLPTNPNNTLVIQVLVTRNRNRGPADQGAVMRLPEEARMITVKTRKAQ